MKSGRRRPEPLSGPAFLPNSHSNPSLPPLSPFSSSFSDRQQDAGSSPSLYGCISVASSPVLVGPSDVFPPSFINFEDDEHDLDAQRPRWRWGRSTPGDIFPRISQVSRKSSNRFWNTLSSGTSLFSFRRQKRSGDTPHTANTRASTQITHSLRSSQSATFSPKSATFSTDVMSESSHGQSSNETGIAKSFCCDLRDMKDGRRRSAKPPLVVPAQRAATELPGERDSSDSLEDSGRQDVETVIHEAPRRKLRHRFSAIFGTGHIPIRELATWSEVDLHRPSYQKPHVSRKRNSRPPSSIPPIPSLPPPLPEMPTLLSNRDFNPPEKPRRRPHTPAGIPNSFDSPKRKSFMNMGSSGSHSSSSDLPHYTLSAVAPSAVSTPSSQRHRRPLANANSNVEPRLCSPGLAKHDSPLPYATKQLPIPAVSSLPSSASSSPTLILFPSAPPPSSMARLHIAKTSTLQVPQAISEISDFGCGDSFSLNNISLEISAESLFDLHPLRAEWPTPPAGPGPQPEPEPEEVQTLILGPSLELDPDATVTPSRHRAAYRLSQSEHEHIRPSPRPPRPTHIPSPSLATLEASLGSEPLLHSHFPEVIELKTGKAFTLLAPSRAIITAYCAFHAQTKLVAEYAKLRVVLDSEGAMESMRVHVIETELPYGADGAGGRGDEDVVSFKVDSGCRLGDLVTAVARVSF